MAKKFDFKNILLWVMFIAFTTTATIAAVWSWLNLLNWDLTSQEQIEFDKELLSRNENIMIYSWETKLISFPRKIESISFSKDSGFSIRTLIWGEWKDISDNPSDYEVMQGYIVRNFTNEIIQIVVKYAPVTSSEQALYQKELKAGWNLYAPAVKNDYCSAVKINDALQWTNYSQVIDFSNMWFKKYFSNEVSIDHVYSGETLVINKYNSDPQTFREDWNYIIKNSNQVEKDFIYEWSAYGVFVNDDTLVSGNQNITDGLGNELIKYNSHPLVVYKNNINNDLDVTNNSQITLLDFDLTSKYVWVDELWTSSILSSLSLNAYDNKWSKVTDVFENILLKIDDVEVPYTTSFCRIDDKMPECVNGNTYFHLFEPKLLTRGLVTNFKIVANAKNNIESNYRVQLDLSNTLILDDQNLLPYCSYEWYILGNKNDSNRNININTSSYTSEELQAANHLESKGIIDVPVENNDYGFNILMDKTLLAKYNAWVAGISPSDTCENNFADVSNISPNTWLCNYVEALLNNWAIESTTHYNPEKILTKAEVVKYVLKAVWEEVVYTEETWKNDYVNHAVSEGYIVNFSDYDTLADRGFYYLLAAAILDSLEDSDILSQLDDLLWWSGSTNTGSTDTWTWSEWDWDDISSQIDDLLWWSGSTNTGSTSTWSLEE